jgi:hypothetical protein
MKTLLLLITIISLPQPLLFAIETQELINKFPEIPDKYYDTENFKNLTYDDYIQETKSLVKAKTLVKEYILEDLFPDITADFCGDDECKTMMYEVVQNKRDSYELQKIPTILLVGGMSYNEHIGVTVLVNFIKYVQKAYMLNKSWFRILSNVRFLVIPAIDMKNYFIDSSKDSLEEIENYQPPMENFNLFPKQQCFSARPSQFLSMIFNSYLILGTLVFTEGDFKIKSPKLGKMMGNNQVMPDELAYNSIGETMAKIFNEWTEKLHPPMEYVKEEETSTRNNSHYKNGTFLEWAFGASSNLNFLKNNCFPPNSNFRKVFRPPTKHSNRSFTFEIQLSADSIEGDIPEALGNQLGINEEELEEANNGIVDNMIFVIKAFSEFLQPRKTVTKIVSNKTSDKEGAELELLFDIKIFGCIHFRTCRLQEPKSSDLNLSKLDINQFESRINYVQLTTKVTFDKDRMLDENTPYDFNFDLDCDSKFYEEAKKYGEFQSHFMRWKYNPSLIADASVNKFRLVKQCDFKYTISNLQLNSLSKNLIFEIMHSKSILFNSSSYMIRVGSFFPLAMDFDKLTSEVTLQRVFHNIPSEERKILEPDLKANTGIVNNAQIFKDNQEISDIVFLMRKAVDLKVSVYRKYLNFVCDNINIDTFKKKYDNVLKLISKVHDLSKKKIDNSIPSKSYVMSPKEELRLTKNSFPCFEYLQKKKSLTEEQSQNGSLFSYTLQDNTPFRMLQNFFIIQRSLFVHITFKTEVDGKMKEFAVNGSIVLPDSDLTGVFNKEDNSPDTPRRKVFMQPTGIEMLTKPYRTYSVGITRGSICTSMNPALSVNEQNLKSFKMSERESKKYKRYFYAITVTQALNNEDQVLVNFFVTQKKNEKMYILASKNKEFKLEQSNTNFDMEGEYNQYQKEVKVYQGKFNTKDFNIISTFVTVFKPGLKDAVFDCLLSEISEENPVRNMFKIFKDIENETNSYKSSSSNFNFIILGVIGVCLVLILIAVLWIVKSQTKKDKDELIEEVEEPVIVS